MISEMINIFLISFLINLCKKKKYKKRLEKNEEDFPYGLPIFFCI